MEDKENNSAGTRNGQLWFFTQVRLALALVIIRNKPAAMNARSYTEALAQNLQKQEQSWREKAEGLQQEVLRLRQEVVLAQVGTVPNSNSSTEQGPDDAEERFSQDLFAPSDPPPDSDSLTPDLLLPDSQPLAPSYRPSQVPLDSSLYGHVNFLQTLCSLQRVKGDSRGLEVLWLSPGGGSGHGASSVLVESVCQLLEAVVGVCTHPGPHSPTPHVVEACDTAVRTMDLLCFLKLPSVEVRKQVEKTLTELTQALLMLQGDQPRQTSEQLVQCLLTLGQSNMSRSFLIGHLLSQISTEANQLWTISQQDLDQRQHQNQNPSPALFRLDQYQNSCQLFWIVEQLLGSSSIRVEVDLEQTGFGRHLDRQAIGNHEFDNGVEGLKPFLKQTQFPVLSANIRTDQTLAATFGTMYRPYTILTVGGQKVGVVGYTSQDTPSLSNTGSHLTFEEEVAALQVNVDKLLTLGVNKIIALGHSGFIKDQEIAQKVQGVDVVVGGHSHTFLYTGTPPSFEKPIGSYPVMVQSDDGRQVPVVQAYRFGKYLGYLKVTFDEAGNVLTSTGNPILLDNSIPQDPDIFAEVNQLKENLAKYTLQVIGKTYVLLNGLMENCRFKECNLGNLICDAVVDYYVRYSGGDHWNIVSACIMNAGGIRASIEERSRNGTITFDDLSAVLPFRGSFDLVQLKGSTLRKAFEHSVKKYGLGTGEFLQVSGIQVEFDMTRPPGSRVRSLSILCTKCRVPRYEAVEDGSVYMVLMTSYMVDGGDGYDMIQEEMLKHTSGDLDISIVSAFISQRKGVYPSLDGRIKIHNSASGLQGRMALLVLTALWTLV